MSATGLIDDAIVVDGKQFLYGGKLARANEAGNHKNGTLVGRPLVAVNWLFEGT